MNKIRFSFLAAIAFVALTVLVGCAPAKDPTLAALEGKWLDASYGKSYYVIDGSEFKNYGENPDGTAYESYEGEDIEIVASSDTAGMIYMKYTKSMNSDFTFSTTAPDVGKWYAVSYKDLTESSVKFSGAYKFDGKTSTETLDEAKAEFTEANGYFAFYSECAKVE